MKVEWFISKGGPTPFYGSLLQLSSLLTL